MSNGKKILVVDDDRDLVDILTMVLTGKAYQVVRAYGPQEALAAVDREHPDLILLDVMMPVVNGFEVCSRLKADPATRDIPVIMLSAMGQGESIDRGMAAGAVDYIVKPFDPIQLSEIVARHLKD